MFPLKLYSHLWYGGFSAEEAMEMQLLCLLGPDTAALATLDSDVLLH